MNISQIGRFISQRRVTLGLTQAQLAQRLDVTAKLSPSGNGAKACLTWGFSAAWPRNCGSAWWNSSAARP